MPNTPAYLEWLTSGGVGAVLMKGADFLLNRKAREVKLLSDQLDRQDARMGRFEERLDECHENHEKCEEGRREDRKKIEDLEAEVRRFMDGDNSGPVAAYTPRKPRHER
jgi:hypothetical protein